MGMILDAYKLNSRFIYWTGTRKVFDMFKQLVKCVHIKEIGIGVGKEMIDDDLKVILSHR